ncbi:hypothetical protein [Polaribacter porphyrae]|uniref:Uncharacterized protein n=1 Tax=Polaribacter porphyrae TaxID=1137780 RepID=A0A2S7WT67_9FLAO|nr:hypothetical protein [Polaribacter porphyrae]PQJ80502.1 hypothetical protein BTO18_15555 [Polaribacter porphyrae]
MKKIILKINNLTEKLHLIIYQITIAFTLFFYFVLKGATGHKFVITSEEVIYSILILLAFIFSGLYEERGKFGQSFNKVISCLLLIFAILTFVMALYYLYFTFTFDYGFKEELIFFLLPILFTWCNFYLIKKIIKELRK